MTYREYLQTVPVQHVRRKPVVAQTVAPVQSMDARSIAAYGFREAKNRPTFGGHRVRQLPSLDYYDNVRPEGR
jgi:hypothetical protein